jgi:hypothetical protein
MFKSMLGSGKSESMSVDLQSGGYNPLFYRLSTIVGIVGILMGFIGFLGVYDDKPGWIRAFLQYMQLRLLCLVLVFGADLYTLSSCEGYASLKEDDHTNAALFELSSRHMCHWGRIAYIFGFILQTIVDLYMLYNVWKYCCQIELNPPYPIDFGYEKYDTTSRWKFYEVEEPEEIPMFTKQTGYDADNTADEDPFKEVWGPDGVKAKPTFAPDGMRGPAYIRAFK